MTITLETYVGWEEPQHFAGCKSPRWLVDWRTDDKQLRRRYEGVAHECANDECQHGGWFQRTTVRIVCPSCQLAVVIRGEEAGTSEGTAAATTHGYGLPPRKVAGLLLWPGEPYLHYGRLSSDEPYDFVVTGPRVKKVTEADVVGTISQSRGKRDAVTWSATALPSPEGPYGYGRIRWAKASTDGSPLRTVNAAARWVGARLAEAGGGS